MNNLKRILSIRSVLAGIGALAIMAILASAGLPALQGLVRVWVANSIDVHGIPSPDQLAPVHEGDLLVVPQGMMYVATGVGRSDAQAVTPRTYQVVIDGVPVVAGRLDMGGAEPSNDVFFWGYPASAGSVVEVLGTDEGMDFVLFGFLQAVPQR